MELSKQSSPFYETKATTIILLYALTLGLYAHYWHYQNWKAIQIRSGDLSLSPLLRGFFYPFFILSLISILRDSSVIAGIKPGTVKVSVGVLYLVLSLLAWFVTAELYALVFLLSLPPVFLLQRKASVINQAALKYSDHSNSGLTGDSAFQVSFGSASMLNKPFNSQGFILPYQYTFELAIFVVVSITSVAFALRDAEIAFAKAKLSEALMLAAAAKVDAGEAYALKGRWSDQNFDYLLGGFGSSITHGVSVSSSGAIHVELKQQPPFTQGDLLSFLIKYDGFTGPMHVNRWQCKGGVGEQVGTRTINKVFLPSVCRG
ncbi:pilin [Alkalimarinus sediminis]|uniref:Pilin n=1 Tax=Alkalimarinus sediminis TaxID=1632866 RepID=A0A9E8HH34_9ALTE|nr:pilin [Alkalimarinus sediminis]UZW74140.1 pilin [Alkalimarinus sediminis]